MLPPLAHNSKGEFRQITFSPAITLQVGDEVVQTGNQLSVIRAGVVVATRTLSGIGSLVDGPVQASQSVSSVLYFRSYPVAGQNVAMTQVQLNQSTGAVTISFSNGVNREYSDIESAKSAVQYLDTQSAVAEDSLILKMFRRSPDGTNLENMVGGAVAINFDADVPFVLTLPE